MRFKEFITEWSDTPLSIKKIMQDKGYKFLGKGVDQSAYLEPKTGKVLKIFGSQGETYRQDGYSRDHIMFKTFANYCEKHSDNQFLPKFDGWEGFKLNDRKFLQIRMERLQKLPTQLGNALENVSEQLEQAHNKSNMVDEIIKHIHELDNDNESPVMLLEPQALEIEKLMVLLGEQQFRLLLNTIANLAKLADQKHYTFDLHGGNFMHRNDGIPVIVDPWVV